MMWAQSLLEYGALSVLVDAFTTLWISARDTVIRINPAWWILALVLYLLLRKRR